MYQVEDAMNRNVITISPDATVEEAIHLLLDHSISEGPRSSTMKGSCAASSRSFSSSR